jgi:protoheme ferro-lyase
MKEKYEEYMGDLYITTRYISPYIPHILQQLNIIKYLILKIHLAPLLSSSSAP